MINAKKFERLSQQDKLTLIFNEGEDLYTRHSEGFMVKLYQLNDFFCEIWYSSEANKIYTIELIDLSKIVGLYDVNIDDLLNN